MYVTKTEHRDQFPWLRVHREITEQGYQHLMLLYSLHVGLRHKLDIFRSKLTAFQNLIQSVIDINNISEVDCLVIKLR